ncbi:hypothetical protein [Tissierella sp. Yu-01]|uniref:hypothetical protein n=1 Tax=Tissierella sp. Yu-01 TaxID=3035694 RepID=UPI00240D79F8|nr:hypothetical protein [Tissierella sp. Yu-01]WFA09063.1 hypothetical protein P3962_00405 [Tissierella sp. Yu-01]
MTSDIMAIAEIKKKIIPILQSYPVDRAILFVSYAKGKLHKYIEETVTEANLLASFYKVYK